MIAALEDFLLRIRIALVVLISSFCVMYVYYTLYECCFILCMNVCMFVYVCTYICVVLCVVLV